MKRSALLAVAGALLAGGAGRAEKAGVYPQVTDVFINGVAQSLETRHTRLCRQFKDRP